MVSHSARLRNTPADHYLPRVSPVRAPPPFPRLVCFSDAKRGDCHRRLKKVEYLPYEQSAQLVQNRQLDATLQSAGLGNPALRDLANNVEVVFIPIPPEVIAKIGDKAYMDGVIPANTYKGQTAAVPTAKIENFLVTRKGVSVDVVYRMTKAMYEHLDQLVAAHAAAKSIKLANAIAGMPIPLHPGAAKYYREVGLIKK